jgi:hypothetical protein
LDKSVAIIRIAMVVRETKQLCLYCSNGTTVLIPWVQQVAVLS